MAGIRQVGTINSPDEIFNRFQDEVAAKVNDVLSSPLLNGKFLKAEVLKAASPVVVTHGLGRLPQGWIIIDRTAAATPWRSAPSTKQTITLSTSADVTVALWVF